MIKMKMKNKNIYNILIKNIHIINTIHNIKSLNICYLYKVSIFTL